MATATSKKSGSTAKRTSSAKRSTSSSSGSKTTRSAPVVKNPAEARAASGAVWVDPHTVQKLGEDPLQGHFVTVAKGDHAGRYGVYEDNGEVDEATLRPKTIVVRTRDERSNERLVVNYDDCKRAGPR